MQEAFYRQTAAIEERHWWFVHRRRVVEELLRRYGPAPTTLRALDVGCGGGGTLRWLAGRGVSAVGIDRSELALGLARSRDAGSALALVDVRQVDRCFAPASFDLVTIFSVLYHKWVDDVAAVLARLGRLLRPGGLLVVNEPALPILFRRHDRIGFGARRFRRRELRDLLEAAGLEPLRVVHLGVLAVPPALLLAGAERLRDALRAPDDDEAGVTELKMPAAPLNRALLVGSGIERAWIGAGLPTPCGVALLALARRRPAG